MGFLDQVKQLGEMKAKMDEIKRKLDETEITEENELLKIVVSGNRRIKSIELKQGDIDAVQLRDSVNAALDKTDAFVQKEMMGAIPQIPGL